MFEYCVFLNNTAIKHGGAVYVWKGALQVLDSTFEDNAAPDGLGGAVASQFGTAVYDRCTFERNEGRFGGGLAISLGCKGRVANSQFMYNPGMSGMLLVAGSSQYNRAMAATHGSHSRRSLTTHGYALVLPLHCDALRFVPSLVAKAVWSGDERELTHRIVGGESAVVGRNCIMMRS